MISQSSLVNCSVTCCCLKRISLLINSYSFFPEGQPNFKTEMSGERECCGVLSAMGSFSEERKGALKISHLENVRILINVKPF